MNEEASQKIVDEIRKQTQYYKKSLVYVLIIVFFLVGLSIF